MLLGSPFRDKKYLGTKKYVITLRPRQYGRHFADDMLKCIFLNENVLIPIEISLKFVPTESINNNPELFQIMAWRLPADKPLPEPMVVRLQNLLWYKTGWVSRQVLHLLSKLQNWIWPKTGQYKTYLVSNTKIEASVRATKTKPWQSHLTSETVEIFIQNEKAGLVPMQSRFWCGR